MFNQGYSILYIYKSLIDILIGGVLIQVDEIITWPRPIFCVHLVFLKLRRYHLGREFSIFV